MMQFSVRGVVTAVVLLGPVTAGAQTTDSFERLPGILKAGQTVVVSSNDGRSTRGKVVSVSATSLTLDVGVFPSDSVTAVERRDSSWNGILIGLGAGIAAARVSVGKTCDLPDPECAAIVTTAIGLPLIGAGALIGWGVDRAIGNDYLYSAPYQAVGRSIMLTPFVGYKRAGAALAMRF